MANLVRVGGGGKPKIDLYDVLANEYNSFGDTSYYASSEITKTSSRVTFSTSVEVNTTAIVYSPYFLIKKGKKVYFDGTARMYSANYATISIRFQVSNDAISWADEEVFYTWTDGNVHNFNIEHVVESDSKYGRIIVQYANTNARTSWTVSFTKVQAEREVTYLYKDGKQNVAWDDTNYTLGSYTHVGSFVLSEHQMDIPGVGSSQERSIGTTEMIDLSQYSKVGVIVNGNTVKYLDISTVQAFAYIELARNESSGHHYFNIFVSSQKTNVLNIKYAGITYEINPIISVNSVWLEK